MNSPARDKSIPEIVTQSQVLVVALLSIGVANASAQSPFFWDTFDRTEELVFTGERDVEGWHLGSSLDEKVWIDAGALHLQPLSHEIASVFYGIEEPIEEFVILATMSFPESSVAGNHFLMNIYWDATSDSFAWGGADANGLGIAGSSGRNQTFQGFAPDVDENSAVNFRLEKSDNVLRARVWLEHHLEDDASWMEVTNPVSTAKALGIAFNASGAFAADAVVELHDFALLPLLPGDFNGSGDLDSEDIDLIGQQLRSPGVNQAFDLTSDGLVSTDDRDTLVHDLLRTWYGDSNLDGEFNSQDLVRNFQAGQYEDDVEGNSRWAAGDWNGDTEFDAADLVLAFQDGGFERESAVNAIPEPSSLVLATIAALVVGRRLRPN